MRWIKMPAPGQFRGEGRWVEMGKVCSESVWEYCRVTGYLPTHEGDAPPDDAPPDAALSEAMAGAELATKADLRELEHRLTIRLGGMLVVAVGVLAALELV